MSELSDDECDPILLRVGIRAPKLSRRQVMQNRCKPPGGEYAKKNCTKFGRKYDGDPEVRKQYFLDYHERRQRQPLSRGSANRK